MKAQSSLDWRERRLISRSMASRMNSARRFGPASSSIASQMSVVSRTSTGLVSDFLSSGGRPILARISDIGISVNLTSGQLYKRYRLLTSYPISVITSISNWLEGQMSQMLFVTNDGGRAAAGFKGLSGDCVVRSVAIAAGLPYQHVYDALSRGNKTQRLTKRSKAKASARDGVYVKRKWFKDFMASIGFEWVPTMQIGSGCKVHLAEGELPGGRLIVAVSGHYTAVIDGVIHDTHDPQRGNSWSFETLIGGRCVYGYWRAAA